MLIINMSKISSRMDVLQGTLDLLVLKTLAGLGPLHGYGIARRIEQQGWIESEWGVSENNRRARFYRLTSLGAKQLETEIIRWRRMSAAVNAIIGDAAAWSAKEGQ